jgi:hypothetical protein
VSTLFGSILVLDLRLLGLWRRVSLATLSGPVVPVAGVGFALAALSGVCMLATNGTEYVGNPFFLVKFPAILVGLANVVVLNLIPATHHRAQARASVDHARARGAAGAFG